jgi:hypothetical protein
VGKSDSKRAALSTGRTRRSETNLAQSARSSHKRGTIWIGLNCKLQRSQVVVVQPQRFPPAIKRSEGVLTL